MVPILPLNWLFLYSSHNNDATHLNQTSNPLKTKPCPWRWFGTVRLFCQSHNGVDNGAADETCGISSRTSGRSIVERGDGDEPAAPGVVVVVVAVVVDRNPVEHIEDGAEKLVFEGSAY